MKPGDYVVYRIRVGNIDNPVDQKHVTQLLERHGVPRSYQHRPTNTEIDIPCLPTFWRGDDKEEDWRDEIERALSGFKPPLNITFEAAPWSPPPGYPRGDLSL